METKRAFSLTPNNNNEINSKIFLKLENLLNILKRISNQYFMHIELVVMMVIVGHLAKK